MNNSGRTQIEPLRPWYREPWLWVVIALPATVVVASMITLWLAISHPDHLVIDEQAYQNVSSELKAARPSGGNAQADDSDGEQ